MLILPEFAVPFRYKRLGSAASASVLYLAILVALLLWPMQSYAATLRVKTVAAWEDYVQSATSSLQDRTRAGGSFLWTDESSERIANVRSGSIVVAPAPGANPRRVPGGLIHHWIGAAFLPSARLDDILAVTQDYDRYKQFYWPSVMDSKAGTHNADDDHFSLLLMNKAFFLKTALAVDCQATNVRLDEHRFYSIATTTRIQEVEDYGRPGEHRRAEGEGEGYIWKLFTIVRLEQRDGGVYFETEAVALSREIPGAVHFIVVPIVRRVSRNSVLESIKQTEVAVHSNFVSESKPGASPAKAGEASRTSAVLNSKNSALAQSH